jgi:hypothetical protein
VTYPGWLNLTSTYTDYHNDKDLGILILPSNFFLNKTFELHFAACVHARIFECSEIDLCRLQVTSSKDR